MQVEIEFNYLNYVTMIQCNTQDNFQKIFHSFANKANIDINTVYFLYSGIILDENSTIEQKINTNDKEIKKMNILVNNKDESKENSIIIKPKDISCPKCGDPARINIKDYKILLLCKNGHGKGNLLLDEYRATQRIDISKIVCDNCKENNKGNSYNNMFFRCCTCNMNLCPLCKNNHTKEHNIINYDEKDYICEKHNQKYISYCED